MGNSGIISLYTCSWAKLYCQVKFLLLIWATKSHIKLIISYCALLSFPLTCSAGTTREHLGLAMALKVPIFIVVSKVDLCTRATVERTVRQLERVLKQPGCNKVPTVISSADDAVTAAQQFAHLPKYDTNAVLCT